MPKLLQESKKKKKSHRNKKKKRSVPSRTANDDYDENDKDGNDDERC